MSHEVCANSGPFGYKSLPLWIVHYASIKTVRTKCVTLFLFIVIKKLRSSLLDTSEHKQLKLASCLVQERVSTRSKESVACFAQLWLAKLFDVYDPKVRSFPYAVAIQSLSRRSGSTVGVHRSAALLLLEPGWWLPCHDPAITMIATACTYSSFFAGTIEGLKTI